MAGKLVNMRKHHAPRDIGLASPQLATNEIAEATGTQSERCQRSNEVEHFEITFTQFARVQVQRRHHAEKTAVKGHPAFPDSQHPERIAQHLVEIVEQCGANAPTHHGTHRTIENQVGNLFIRPEAGAASCAQSCKEPYAAESDNVHDAVPVDCQRAEREGNGIELRINQHGQVSSREAELIVTQSSRSSSAFFFSRDSSWNFCINLSADSSSFTSEGARPIRSA